MFNYELFLKCTKHVPSGLDRKKKKEKITKEIRKKLEERDKLTCQMCGLKDKWGYFPGSSGKLAVHHIIPNGSNSLDNLITLCKYCHYAVHLVLFVDGKWRYVPMR